MLSISALGADMKQTRWHIFRLIAVYALNVFDYFCTMLFVSMYGPEIEGNALMSGIVGTPWQAGLIKFAAVGVLLLFLGRNADKPVSIAGGRLLFLAYAALGCYHVCLLCIVFG